MDNNRTKRLILAGLFVALGVIIPYFTAHGWGVPGNIFLPMHFPVFLAGLVTGPQLGALTGIITPILSSLLTGMPPVFPMLPMMIGELFVYGLIAGIIRNKFKSSYIALIIAMVLGRIVHAFIGEFFIFGTNGANFIPTIIGTTSKGLPGIIGQLILIPPLVKIIEKAVGFKNEF